MSYAVLAFYHLVQLDHPEEEVKEHKAFLSTLDAKSRIYISTQGINGQMSIHEKDAKSYMEWLSQKEPFQGVEFKIQAHPEHCFPRLTIKLKKELVALGEPVAIDSRAEYMTPKEWRQTLEGSEEKIILDVRNSYESKVGHFQNAEIFACDTFRDFKESAKKLKERLDPKTKVLMYCTGGIRCEIFSSLLKKEGIHNLFQLHGGVIRYGVEEGTKHWLGKLFVFDDRLAVPLSQKEDAEVIGKCHHCGQKSESYYNCANMDCNELFLACPQCLEKFHGCCKAECQSAKRVRPFQYSHKPFRKWYHYAKTKEELSTLSTCSAK